MRRRSRSQASHQRAGGHAAGRSRSGCRPATQRPAHRESGVATHRHQPPQQSEALRHPDHRSMIVALAGGVGAARFLDGLTRVIPPQDLFVIGNTGDDAEIHGLHISPDLDTVMYTLAGLANRAHGWGLQGDTFHNLDALRKLGGDAWFQLGDRDLATHILRTERLKAGAKLSEVTREISQTLGVRSAIV